LRLSASGNNDLPDGPWYDFAVPINETTTVAPAAETSTAAAPDDGKQFHIIHCNASV